MDNCNEFSFYFYVKKSFFEGEWLPKIADGIDLSIIKGAEWGDRRVHNTICFYCNDEVSLGDYYIPICNEEELDGIYVQVMFFFDCNQILVLSSGTYRSINTLSDLKPIKEDFLNYFDGLKNGCNMQSFVYTPEKDTIASGLTEGKWVGIDEFVDKLTNNMAKYKNGRTLFDHKFLALLKDKFYKAKNAIKK